MGSVASFTDAKEVARSWVNDNTPAGPGLAGIGKPLTNGCHLSVRQGSPGHATFCVVTRLATGDHPGGQGIDNPRLSFTVYGAQEANVAAAAIALANALRSLAGNPRTYPGKGKLLHASRITVSDQPDGTRPRYIVDADLAIAPA